DGRTPVLVVHHFVLEAESPVRNRALHLVLDGIFDAVKKPALLFQVIPEHGYARRRLAVTRLAPDQNETLLVSPAPDHPRELSGETEEVQIGKVQRHGPYRRPRLAFGGQEPGKTQP